MPNSARSDGGGSSLNSARSTARAASEGATPRSVSLLGPDWDLGVRKHLYAATLSSSSRNLHLSPAPPCPVHCYSGQGTPYDRTPATFGKARTGRGLLVVAFDRLSAEPLLMILPVRQHASRAAGGGGRG